MDARFSPQDEVFRSEFARWLEQNLRGDFEVVKGRGGPGDEHALFEERHAWERLMGRSGWIGVGWPKDVGGRGLPLSQQMIFHEEYARAGGPGRVGHIGEGLLGPTVIHFGSADQKARFLPKILSGDEVWCQGYSEPGAGIRSRERADPRRAPGRRVDRERSEGLDLGRRVVGLVLRRLPHGSAGAAQAPGHLVSPRPDGPARRRGAPDRADDRGLGVQRGLLQQCEGREGRHRRQGERRLGRRDGDARLRARRLDPRPADALPERARPDHPDREAERHAAAIP